MRPLGSWDRHQFVFEQRQINKMPAGVVVAAAAIIPALLCLTSVVEAQQEGLQKGFYSSTCPDAEDIVRATVEKYFNKNSTVAPALLRLHFHDCFVQGCDGSVLISGPSAERTAVQNTGLRGFEVVEDAKAQLEAACPGVVSCADVLALAARDAVDLSDGPSWSVPLGRRDGRVSSAPDAASLPAPTDSFAVQKQKFADRNLTVHDLVTLVGAHTIGRTECQFFSYRLYNFTVTGNADPSIDSSFLSGLRSRCPQDGDASVQVELDEGSAAKFDVSFFKNLRDGKGVLESDQRLWEDDEAQDLAAAYASTIRGLLGLKFARQFSKAMVSLSSVGVKTGAQGEIRKICSKVK